MLTKVSEDQKLTQGLAYIVCLFVYFPSSFKKGGGEGGGREYFFCRYELNCKLLKLKKKGSQC
jgi:hypothetical protein